MRYHSGMRTLLATAFLVFSLLASALPAGAAGFCPPLPGGGPHAAFGVDFPPQPRLDVSLSRADIQSSLPTVLAHGWDSGGMTSFAYETRVAVRLRTLDMGDGTLCAQLDSALGGLMVTDLTVHVAREHRPGTCQHQAILAHELEHADIARQAVARHLPALREALDRAARGLPPLRVKRGDDPVPAVTRLLLEAVARPAQAMEREMAARHATLDSPGSYLASSRLCPSW